MKSIDPLQLQRLVDGELDPTEVQQLLTEAKVAPDQWQEIAVGFVENQIWDRAFQSEEPTSHLPPEHHEDAPESVDRKTDPNWEIPSEPKSTGRPNTSRWVMAASLMVAAAMGYMTSQIQNRNIPSTQLANDSTHSDSEMLAKSESQSPESMITPAALEPDCHLEVPQDNQYLGDVAGTPMAPVPLFRIQNSEQLKSFRQKQQASVPPEIVKQLSGSGYQMQQDIHYISGRLGDGRSFVVPVRTIRFYPGQ